MKKPKNMKAETGEPKPRGRPPGSGKKATEAKPPKAPKEPKVSRGDALRAAAGDNSADPKLRELYLHHMPKVVDLREKMAKANSALRRAYKEAKADGFTKQDFDIGIELSTPEGEQAFKVRVATQLRVAQYVGAAIGNQFDLFADFVDRTPIQERAYDEGQKASMSGLAMRCDYDPNTEAFREFERGWSDHQASMLSGGIKQKEPDEDVAMTRNQMDDDDGFTRRTAH